MSLMVLGLAIFLGVHLLPALPESRAALIAQTGEPRYKRVFSLAAATGLVLIVAGFATWHSDQRLFAPVSQARMIAPAVMTLSFILLAAANMRGHLRHWLSHPMLIGVLLWASVHLLANGDVKGTMLFGGFLAYALIDLASAIRRHAVKSFVPELRFDVRALIGGIVIASLVMTFHRLLFGVRVVPFGL